jgi:hypothetical protein
LRGRAELALLLAAQPPQQAQNKLDAIFIISASSVALKKNARTQWIKPVLRIALEVKLMSAVCPDVPITQAK